MAANEQNKYDRSQLEDKTALCKYRDKTLDGKRTAIDPYTKETIYVSSNGVDKGRGDPRHYTTKRVINVDHTVPLKNFYDEYEERLCPEEIKKLANQDVNYELINEQLNKSKSEMSNLEYIMDQRKKGTPLDPDVERRMLADEAEASAVLHAQATGLITMKAANQGAQTAMVTLTVSGINNLVDVANGKKDLETAIEDVCRDTARSFASGAGMYLAQDAMRGVANKIKNETLKNITSAQVPVTEIAMTAMVAGQVKDYLDGKISADDCAVNILLNGAGTLAYQMGMAMGGPAGAIIASIVVTQISNTIIEYRQAKMIEKAREAEVNRILREAMTEIHIQHDRLKEYVEKELKRWDDTVEAGFNQIFSSADQNDAEGITSGLNVIIAMFNKSVVFQSLADFDSKFFDPDAEPIIL